MRALIVTALASLSFALGCAPTQAGDECLSDSDCGVGFTCEHAALPDGSVEQVGACTLVPCEADEDCPSGFTCDPEQLVCLGE